MALSRSRGWGARRKGSWRRGKLACTVFLAGGDGKGECRRVCELDCAADEIARVTHGEGRFRARWSVYQNLEEEKGRSYGWCVVVGGTADDDGDHKVVVVDQVVIVVTIMAVVVVVIVMAMVVVVVMVASIRLASFPRWIIETPPDRCHKRKTAVRLEMTGFRVTHTLCTRPLLPGGLRTYIRALTYKKLLYPSELATVSRVASLLSFSCDYVALLSVKWKKARDTAVQPRSGPPLQGLCFRFVSLHVHNVEQDNATVWMSYFVILIISLLFYHLLHGDPELIRVYEENHWNHYSH